MSRDGGVGGWKSRGCMGWTTKMKRRRDNHVVWDAEGWSRDMSALLTFRRRHGGWRRGRSAGEGDKYRAVKWRSHRERWGNKMARGK